MEILIVLVLIVVALFAVLIGTTYFSKVQSEAVVSTSPDRVYDIVTGSFAGLLWRPVDGPGDVNYRRRSINDTGPVISVDIDPDGAGGSVVQVWMSHFTTRGPWVMFAEAAIGQRRKVIRRVQQSDPSGLTPTAAAPATTTPATTTDSTPSANPADAIPATGSAPAAQANVTAPGWYDDGSGRRRYWNGSAWTEHYAS